jgi:uncharacterized protein (TIGR02271 family)
MAAPLPSPSADATGDDVGRESVVPLFEETLDVTTEARPVGAVRVRIEVEQGSEHVGADLASEELRPTVRAVGTPVEERRDPYLDGDEIVVPVYEERLVVERRLFLKEEVRLGRVRRVEHREGELPVRRERAVLERQQPDGSWIGIECGAPLATDTSSPPPPVGGDEINPFICRRDSMNQTVVGVFDSYEAAERAAAELGRLGFERSEMQIQAADGSGRSTTTGSGSSRSSDDEDEGTGVMASIRHFFAELFGDDDHAGNYAEAVRRGSAVLTVEADDTRLDVARQALTNAGAVDIDERVSSWRSEGWTGNDETASTDPRAEAKAEREDTRSARRDAKSERTEGEREDVLPVVKEELQIGKRAVSGGAVRVVSRVVSRPVKESVELRREEAVVERRPVDREASKDDLGAFQERTVEVQEMAERPVVQKTARVVEEVVVGKRVSSDTQVVEDTVRSTEVNVERVGEQEGRRSEGAVAGAVGGAATTARRSFADLDDDFRQDYRTNYASSGGTYEDYQPAYRSGYELRSDSRYANRDWDAAEPEIRQRWESEHPGSAWERFKAAIRRGWDRATS